MVELQFYMGIVRFGNGIFPISRSAIQNGIVSTVKDFCSRESAFTAGSIRACPVTVTGRAATFDKVQWMLD
jgi:hypothetical protein